MSWRGSCLSATSQGVCGAGAKPSSEYPCILKRKSRQEEKSCQRHAGAGVLVQAAPDLRVKPVTQDAVLKGPSSQEERAADRWSTVTQMFPESGFPRRSGKALGRRACPGSPCPPGGTDSPAQPGNQATFRADPPFTALQLACVRISGHGRK